MGETIHTKFYLEYTIRRSKQGFEGYVKIDRTGPCNIQWQDIMITAINIKGL